MDLNAIRNGIRDLLDDVLPGDRVYGYVPDNIAVPAIIIYPEHIDYTNTYDNTNTDRLIIWCLAGTVSMQTAQEIMDAWLDDMSPSSIIAALSTDETLGGAVDSSSVLEMRNYGTVPLQDGGTRYLSAELIVEVFS